ncbi:MULTISPECIES: hypothetical protein [unclassified Curtobacterium]|uniref:hypothetical protein n=1 Tax=unclassified Curtobacterium TaxID=257496 RepID=UPI0008DCE5B4|nr:MULTISPECIES: hypothetical protein [unclassified Curtobacterium]OIH97414.1 hypothetical protein BIU92_15565 [Curtobacterium sp. MCBA15_003]OII10264.1 hypothetical protein BIU97_11880 [Curtobacterium sp. MCBA15_009]OII29414.1 hypothetical protein BIU94_11930 [Curtobacterium sp. MMLR14_006]
MRIRTAIASIGTVLAVTAGLLVATPAAPASAAAPTTGRFTPVAPARAWSGTATKTATTVTLGGRNGIPATATAVVLTATVTAPTAAGYVSVAPAGSTASPAIQNFAKAQPISGTTTVGLTSGKAQVRVSAGKATVALDVAGWYGTSASGSTYTPLAPSKVLDGTVRTTATRVVVAGRAGVPTNATAVVLQADVSRPATSGRLRITPSGNDAGVVSVMYSKGVTVANTTTVRLSGGAVQARVSSGSARVLADVVGYYAPVSTGSVFVSTHPVRAATVAAGTTAKTITVAGTAGVPRNATAAVINAKVGKGTVGGSLRVVGAGLASSVPTQVYAKGQTIGNALIAPLASGGRVQAKVSAGSATVYVDVVGYFLDGSSGSGTGVDVSYPQCGKSVPTDQSFGIVGVNGDLGNTSNTCFQQQLGWAASSIGGTKQPKAQLYVLAANPGAFGSNSDPQEPGSKEWPTSNTYPAGVQVPNPLGTCVKTSTTKPVTTAACSYMYGYMRAFDDVKKYGPSNPASYRWWIDVETGLSWQIKTSLNQASLQGMVDGLKAAGVTSAGVYSTGYQFSQIMGDIPATSALRKQRLPSWIAIGDGRLDQAQAACSSRALLDGPVLMTQYVTPFGSSKIDRDWSCS